MSVAVSTNEITKNRGWSTIQTANETATTCGGGVDNTECRWTTSSGTREQTIMQGNRKSSSAVESVAGKKRETRGSGDNEAYSGQESDPSPTQRRLLTGSPMGTSSG